MEGDRRARFGLAAESGFGPCVPPSMEWSDTFAGVANFRITRVVLTGSAALVSAKPRHGTGSRRLVGLMECYQNQAPRLKGFTCGQGSKAVPPVNIPMPTKMVLLPEVSWRLHS